MDNLEKTIPEKYKRDECCENTRFGWRVEFRAKGRPFMYGDLLIAGEWLELSIRRMRLNTALPTKVPMARVEDQMPLLRHGLATYVTAEAFRWAWLAELDAWDYHASDRVETRLVQYEIREQYAVYRLLDKAEPLSTQQQDGQRG